MEALEGNLAPNALGFTGSSNNMVDGVFQDGTSGGYRRESTRCIKKLEFRAERRELTVVTDVPGVAGSRLTAFGHFNGRTVSFLLDGHLECVKPMVICVLR